VGGGEHNPEPTTYKIRTWKVVPLIISTGTNCGFPACQPKKHSNSDGEIRVPLEREEEPPQRANKKFQEKIRGDRAPWDRTIFKKTGRGRGLTSGNSFIEHKGKRIVGRSPGNRIPMGQEEVTEKKRETTGKSLRVRRFEGARPLLSTEETQYGGGTSQAEGSLHIPQGTTTVNTCV